MVNERLPTVLPQTVSAARPWDSLVKAQQRELMANQKNNRSDML